MENPANDFSLIERRFKFLLVSRASRSAALIFVTLSSPLYLLLLNFDIVSIGLIYLFVSISTTMVSLLIGILGDRIGFRKAMILGEMPALFLTLVLTFSVNTDLILAGIIVSGTTGAAGAMRGAMSPGINAFIANNWPGERDRVTRMGMITSVASFFSIAGSLMLYSHGYFISYLGPIGSFRLLYGISLVLVIISTVSLFMLKEAPMPKKRNRIMRKASGKHVLKVVASNAVNGTGIGLAIVLLPAWFELRYGLTPSQVGLAFLATYVGSALGGYLATRTRGTRINGTLNVATITRIVQGALMIAVALSPFVIMAIAIYSTRTFVAGFGVPSRNAINVSGIKEGDYGAATSIQGVSSRVSQGFSGLSGYLMDIDLPFPLILGGIIQSFSGLIYYKLMKKP